MNKDYRKNKRVKPHTKIDVIDFMTGDSMGELLNISRDGILLNSDRKISRGEMFQTILDIRDEAYSEISVGVECLWTDSPRSDFNFSGLHIIDISEQDQSILDKVIENSEEI